MINDNSKKYYTIEEAKIISDEKIRQSAEKLILELRENNKIIVKEEIYA